MSASSAELFAGFILALIFIVVFKKWPVKKDEGDVFEKQILALFTPGEKIPVCMVSERLLQKTGGRKDVSDAELYDRLDALTVQKKLEKETVPSYFFSSFSSEKINRVMYSLPE